MLYVANVVLLSCIYLSQRGGTLILRREMMHFARRKTKKLIHKPNKRDDVDNFSFCCCIITRGPL
jgi:hypothetical protein